MSRRQFLHCAGLYLILSATLAFGERPAPKAERFGPNEGEVLRVDRKAGEIIIRHGPLPELDMPPMSMAFNVADAAFFDKVRKRDRVRFKAGLVDGRFAITAIERIPSR